MQRPGEIVGTEPDSTAREHCQDLHLQRVDHINESDSGEVDFQMPEVDVTQMPASEKSHMIPAGKLAGEKAFAGLKMALPRAPTPIGAVAYGDLLGQEAVRSCAKRGRCEAPFQ
jgi:hypothetical protein